MKFLFLDEEFASSKGKKSYICSFGYVLTDVSLNILKKGDIFINPETKFDNFVLENILNHDASFYRNKKNFYEVYPEIKELFDSETIIIGHEIRSDIQALITAIKRYNLEMIDFDFCDSKILYTRLFKGREISPGLDSISLELRCERQDSLHESLDDATIVLEQMKRITSFLDKDLIELINENEASFGRCEKGEITMYDSMDLEYSEDSMHLRKNMNDFMLLIDTLDVNRKGLYSGKRFSLSPKFYLDNAKDSIALTYKLMKEGGVISFNLLESDYYVSVKGDDSRRFNEALNIQEITLIDIDSLKESIKYQEKDRTKYYDEALNEISKEEIELETESSFSLSDLFKDFM